MQVEQTCCINARGRGLPGRRRNRARPPLLAVPIPQCIQLRLTHPLHQLLALCKRCDQASSAQIVMAWPPPGRFHAYSKRCFFGVSRSRSLAASSLTMTFVTPVKGELARMRSSPETPPAELPGTSRNFLPHRTVSAKIRRAAIPPSRLARLLR